MNTVTYLIILLLSVAVLIFLDVRLKANNFITPFITAAALGILFGTTPSETLAAVNDAFGSAIGNIGMVVILGAVLAMGVQDSGTATAITNFFIRLFKGKRLELAPALTAFIMSISVFGDITQLLTSPIAACIRKCRNISMSVVAPYTIVDVWLTHGVVPPSAGILAVCILPEADVGMSIFRNILVCLATFLITCVLTIGFIKRAEFVEAEPEFVTGVVEADRAASVEELLIKENRPLRPITVFLPLVVSALPITVDSLGNMFFKDSGDVLTMTPFIGDKTVAMLIGVIIPLITCAAREDQLVGAAGNSGSPVSDRPSFLEPDFGNWVEWGIKVAAMVIMITVMGGAFSTILKSYPAVNEIASVVVTSSVPTLLIPFAISTVIGVACGSMATATIAATRICAPIMGAMGLAPVAVALSIDIGSLLFDYVNDSSIWMCCKTFNPGPERYLKYVTPITALAGIIGFILLLILNTIGLL